MMSRWALDGGQCILSLLLAVACGGHSRGNPSPSEGGSVSSGGTASTDGAIPSAGTSTHAPEPCTYQSLAVRCDAEGSCPKSASDFELQCALDLDVRQATTKCGGTAVDVSSGYGNTTWYFDTGATLTGAVSTGDVLGICADGRLSSLEVYGTACEVEEPWIGLCPQVDPCDLAPVSCDGAPSCHESIDAVLNASCSDVGALTVTSSPTTCGGTLILVDRGNGVVGYCFNAQSVLVGMSVRATVDGRITLKGSDCRPEGDVALACSRNR